MLCALLSFSCSSTSLHGAQHAHHHSEPAHPAVANHCVLHSLVLPAAPAVSTVLPFAARLSLSSPLILNSRADTPPQPPPQPA
jgi:hypothetical protein